MSLFAFATELCRDWDVTPDATRTEQCRATGAPSTSAAAIAAGAAAKAPAENFPVALRLLPRRYRGHLAAVLAQGRRVEGGVEVGVLQLQQDLGPPLGEVGGEQRRLLRQPVGLGVRRLAVAQTPITASDDVGAEGTAREFVSS